MPISTPAARRLFCLALLALVALAGCGSGPDSQEPDRKADAPPVSCPFGDAGAASTVVFVSPNGSDSGSCGGAAGSACATIGAAIARCSVAHCAVAVRHGLYPTTETIVLRDAVSVHGSCRFGDEPDQHYRTVIEASPPAGMPAIDANGINSATVVSGLLVLGKDETAPGEASVGMRVNASRGLTLAAVTLATGSGGGGAAGNSANGGPGGNGEAPRFADTADNAPGGPACPAEPSQPAGRGGLGTESFDFSATSASCVGACACYPVEPKKKTLSLTPLFMGQGSGKARGGMYGENGNSGPSCNPLGVPPPTAGQPGSNGELGDCSLAGGKRNDEAEQAAGPPRLVDGRWIASFGGPGERGGNGGGGGGGGAGGYAYYNVDREIYYRGLPGGGGGGGGCGGAGGGGGQQGGASIPLILIDTTLSGLANAVLIPGRGGPGGRGGNGGGGGAGGLGGAAPFPQTPWPLFAAFMVPGLGGKGGDGGGGGAGAGGAGGNGGPAPAVALAGNSPAPDLAAAVIYSGTPGAPGAYGIGGTNPARTNNINSQCRGGDGEEGLAGSASSTLRIKETR